jgi:hypothetical protein
MKTFDKVNQQDMCDLVMFVFVIKGVNKCLLLLM